MDIEVSLTLLAVAMFVTPLLVGGAYLRSRQATWGSWGLGALSFFASLFLRVPLFVALGWLVELPFLPEWLRLLLYGSGLCFIAGLTEEWVRYALLREVSAAGRRHDATVAFGLGHGGLEAMLIGLALLLFAWSGASAPLAALTPLDVELSNWLFVLPVLERVFSTLFHVAASLWTSFAVRVDRRRLVWLAVAAHTAFNLVAILVNAWVGPVAAEVALGLVTAGLVVPALLAGSKVLRRLDASS